MQLVSAALPTARSSLHSGLAAVILWGFTATVATHLQAQSLTSPAGTWDFVLSGSGQKGIAFVTFKDDQTFSGYQILSTSPKNGLNTGGRNLGGNLGRGIQPGDIANATNKLSSTNLFGFGKVTGPWAYDVDGNVIGNFSQVVDGNDEGSNAVVVGVSFSAKVVPGKRMTLVAKTTNGKVTYKGVPSTPVPGILNGAWYGIKQKKGNEFTEFFTLTSVQDDNPFEDTNPDLKDYPGIYYTLDGQGPGYELLGFSMLSSQKKIAFTFQSSANGATSGATNGASDSVLNASFGTFSNSKGVLKGSTSGVESPDTAISYKFRQPLSPPAAN
jgi:hypothetical protein